MEKLRIAVKSLTNGAEARLDVVIHVPVAEAHGLAVGLYRIGPEGSSCGVYVWDAANEKPPRDRLGPHSLAIGGEARPDEGWHLEARPV